MGRRVVHLGIVTAICLTFSACGGGNSNPVPQITSLVPSAVPAGEGAFTLAITGTNMNGSSTVEFGSNQLTVLVALPQPCPTGMNCAVTLLVNVQAGQVADAGTQKITVTTAGRKSGTLNFGVLSPQIVTMSPLAVPAGTASFPLTLTVLNAAPTVQVQFGTPGNGNPPLLPPGPVSCSPQTACSVVVNVPATNVKSSGSVNVTVSNPLANSGGNVATNFLVTGTTSGQFPLEQSANGGTPGDASSTHSAVSDGGMFVAFDSLATNLTNMPTNGLSQVYLRQNCFGSGNCTPQTTLISAASGAAGAGGIVGSDRPAISADGRYVVFESDDTNLASGVTQPIEQVYLYDSCANLFGAVKNCTPKLTLISANGSAPGDGPSTNASISAFGLFIAFQSSASNLTSTMVPAGVQQVYLFQSCNGVSGAISGCTAGTQLLSTDANGNPGDADSASPSVDAVGLGVAFESLADNMAAGQASNGARQIYLRTTCLEGVPFLQAPCLQQTVLVSADSGGRMGNTDSFTPSLANNNGGLFTAYATAASNLLPANASVQEIVGALVCPTLPTTIKCVPSGNRVLSVDQNGMPGTAASSNPSASGTRVVFTSAASLKTGVSGVQVYGVPVCLTGSCPSGTVVISMDGTGTPIGGDFGALGGGGLAAFSTPNSAGASGIGEIFLATPF